MPARRRATELVRCPWAKGDEYVAYHDLEWGVPVHDDRLLFEFLILEGAQAGLSWSTILRKRDKLPGRVRRVRSDGRRQVWQKKTGESASRRGDCPQPAQDRVGH
jgi:hypothetical protein